MFASPDLHTRLSKTMEADTTKGTTFSPGPGYEATLKSYMVHTNTITPGSGIATNSVVMQEQGLRFTDQVGINEQGSLSLQAILLRQVLWVCDQHVQSIVQPHRLHVFRGVFPYISSQPVESRRSPVSTVRRQVRYELSQHFSL